MIESVMGQARKRWMSSFDIRWEFWQKVEAMLKAGNYQCDLLSEPIDLVHVINAHCSKGPIDGKVVVEIPSEPKETCRIIVLNSTEEMRDRIHKEGRHYDVAEYDKGRYGRGEPSDVEFHVPCNRDDIENELAILYKAGFAYGEVKYYEITDAGDTVFRVGAIVSVDDFNMINEGAIRQGKLPAIGRPVSK